jgi:two-component system cell cycle response regulator
VHFGAKAGAASGRVSLPALDGAFFLESEGAGRQMKEFEDVSEKTRVTDAVAIKPTESAQDASLVLIYPPGPNLGRRYELKGKVITIGRDQASDILVSSDSVSRRHARLTMEGTRRILTDLESTNGSYVGDQPIISHALHNGDQVKIGDTIFKYLEGSDIEASYHEEIYRMTIIDGLTGVFNKRYFLEALGRETARAQRYGRPLSILMFDIDHFKRVNDTYGHLAGDYVLQSLARVISTRARREEIFARYGGEEFVILLPETQKEGAMELAEQLRKRVSSHTFVFEAEEIPVTVSIGVSTVQDENIPENEIIRRVDEKLYLAKSEGRNCVRG